MDAGLASRALELVGTQLEKREQQIIGEVTTKLTEGPVDPQYAVQQWLAVSEIRRLRRALTAGATQGAKA